MILAIFVFLQILDIYTTYRIVGKEGGREVNPFLAKLFEKIGILPVLLAMKTLAVVLVTRYLIGVSVAVAGHTFGGDQVVAVFCVIYAIVVAHNFTQLRKD